MSQKKIISLVTTLLLALAATYFTDDATVSRHQVHLKVDSLAVGFFVKYLK